MSIKENVDFLKEEISTQEKFFEGFFHLEKIWKKYKTIIISTITIVFLTFLGTNINSYLKKQNTIKANEAFNTLLISNKDTSAIATLKDLNPQLLLIANYLNGNTKDIQEIEFINEIVQFNTAITTNNLESINKTILNSKFLLKEYALFQKALILTLDNKFIEAKEAIILIPQTSPVYALAEKLKHHLLSK